MNIPFVNFHTHQLINSDLEISIFNLSGKELPLPLTDGVRFSYGIHPFWLTSRSFDEVSCFNILESLVNKNLICAIGECGLDKRINGFEEKQINLFVKQLEFAVNFKIPVIVHCVKAYSMLLFILKKYIERIPVVLHGVNSSSNEIKKLIDLGCYFSFGKDLFNVHSNACRWLKCVSIDRLLLETDDSNCKIQDIYSAAASLLVKEDILKGVVYDNYKRIIKQENI